RIAPELGRTFSPDDDVPGAPATVILGHSLWTERYGADERRTSGVGGGSAARNLLVVAETALGVIVLLGAGLLLRSFVQLASVPLGFQPDRVLSFRVILPASRYDTLAKRSAFYRAVAEKLDALPGVRSASAISFLPLTMSGRTSGINIEGEPPPGPGMVRFVDFRTVIPGYFATMNIPMVRGRDLAWSDTPDRLPSVIVSQTAARSFWPNEDAVGKRLKLSRRDSDPWLTVVGVVGNVQQLDLVNQPRPAVYLPSTQDSQTGETLRDWVIRAAGDPTAQAAAARNAVWSIDPTLPVTRVQTMSNVRSASLASGQFNVLVAGLFAALALVLSAVGLYGVTSYAVSQRTRELGIRMALGAGRSDVLKLVVSSGLRLVLFGLAIGFVAALFLTGLMSALLFGIGAHDPVTFVAVAAVLIAVSLTACYIPAWRASRVDPLLALRT
ncbi:MAG TPA: FtsX-like permease family protein, partial [Vicinamibacterales bacterium]|nr:FtsX-like permease family protein [Vicinamibacterales bacterium]